MSKQDEIMNRFGANLAESMGAGRTAKSAAGLHGATTTSGRHQGAGRLKSGAEIAIDRIVPDPTQPRTEFEADAIERLAESLKSHGQIQPITVRWSEGMDRYLIVSGERRWRAANLAGLRTLAAVVLDGEPDASRILEIQLVENCLREDLAPIERARAFKTLMDSNGWNGARLAEAIHVDPSSITRTIALLDLPCTVQDAVADGSLAPSVAYEIGKLEDSTEQAEVAAMAVSGKMSRSEVVETIRAKASKPTSKGRGPKTKPRKTSVVLKASNGTKVSLENRKGLDDASILAALEDVAASMRGKLANRSEAA